MSKIIALLLIVMVAISFVVATNPQARERALELWEQWQPAWVEFSQDFLASVSAIVAEFRERFNEANSAG